MCQTGSEVVRGKTTQRFGKREGNIVDSGINIPGKKTSFPIRLGDNFQ